jgi:hypothetical protein
MLNCVSSPPASSTIELVSTCNAAHLLSRCSFVDCDYNPANGCEVNTMTDANNCGGCGQVASLPNANATCLAGQPVFSSCLTG